MGRKITDKIVTSSRSLIKDGKIKEGKADDWWSN